GGRGGSGAQAPAPPPRPKVPPMRYPPRSAVGDRPARPCGTRAGAAAVEFAVVGSAFFVLLLGIVELGRAFMVRHLLTNAARQGCRVGVLSGRSTQQISDAATQALTNQGVNSSSATVQVNDGSADASTAQSGDEITVIVSVPTSNISWLPFTKYV